MSLSDAMSDAVSDRDLISIVSDFHLFVVSVFRTFGFSHFRFSDLIDVLKVTLSMLSFFLDFQIFGFPGFPDFGCPNVGICVSSLILRMYSFAFAGVPASAGAYNMAKLVVLPEWYN